MTVLVLRMTDAGLAAVQAASGTDPVILAQVGLTATTFDYAPTLTALPGEFRRLDVLSGVAAAPNITHLTAYDTSSDVWTATGLGLYTSAGILFGVVAGAEPLMAKAGVAFALLVVDIAFEADLAANISFGNAVFTWPPATPLMQGVAELATQAETDAGTDDQRIVTPLKLATRLAAFLAPITDALGSITTALETFALKDRTIAGGGLVSGGGDLSANRTLTVTAASAAELQAATEAGRAVTPASFGGLPRLDGATACEVRPGGTLLQRGQVRTTYTVQGSVAITFPVAFANTDYDLQLTTVIPSAGDYDNYAQEIAGTRTPTGVSIYLQDPSGGGSATLAGFNWRAEGKA